MSAVFGCSLRFSKWQRRATLMELIGVMPLNKKIGTRIGTGRLFSTARSIQTPGPGSSAGAIEAGMNWAEYNTFTDEN